MSFSRSGRRRVTASAITLALIAAWPTGALGAWQPNGIPVAPADSTVIQFGATICPDGANGAYVTWKEVTLTDTGNAHLQRITSDGTIAPGWPLSGLRFGT